MLATLYSPALSAENVLVMELVTVEPHDDGEKFEVGVREMASRKPGAAASAKEAAAPRASWRSLAQG
jgi:hypothetical protein